MPVALAFGWSAWLHLALTGWFTYLFLRRIDTGRAGAVAGAVVWQGNGFFVAWMHLPTVLCTASWLPLTLLLVEQALVRGRARLAVAAGVALGLAYLGGHPQVFLFLSLLTVAYIVARGLSSDAGEALADRVRKVIVTGAVTGIVGGGLASIQLLPTLALLQIAHRTFTPGPESYKAFLSHAMPPIQLAGLLMPHAFGHPALGSYAGRDNYAEFACYVGIVALALALWAMFACRRWHARFFAVALLVVLLIALGTAANWPLYRWLPGFARSGGPARILVLAVFALSMLAGMGVSWLSQQPAKKRRGGFPFGLLAPSLLLMAANYAWQLLVMPVLAPVQPGILALSDTEVTRATLLCFPVFWIIALLTWNRRTVAFAQVAVVFVFAADLFLASQQHLHVTPTAWVYPQVSIGAPAQGRVLGDASDWPINRFPNAVLPPNSATVYHLRDAFGYDSLYLARFRDFAAALEHGDPSPPLNGNMLLARLGSRGTPAPVYGLDMMSLAAVETVLSPAHVRGLKMETAGAYYTYSNPYARPRAWVASSAVFVPTHNAAVVSLAELGPMPDTIIVTGPDDLGPPRTAAERGLARRPSAGEGGEVPAVTLKDLSPNSVQVIVSSAGSQPAAAGYLFLADAYAPGWRAYAQSRVEHATAASRLLDSSTPRLLDLPIRPANVAFRTVALPTGVESVTFRYEPESFRVGLFVTLLACAAVAATVAVVAHRR